MGLPLKQGLFTFLGFFIFFSLSFLGGTKTVHGNPNMETKDDYESYLYRIFKKYYQEPVSEDQWKKVVKKPQSYLIQKGDTLWDISRILFGDPFYWPKLWSLNVYITNPHLIREGNELQIHLGSTQSAPSVSISEQASPHDPSSSMLSYDSHGQAQAGSPSPNPSELSASGNSISSKTFFRPPLNVLPPSLPNWYISTSTEDKKDTLRINVLKRQWSEGRIPLPFYISRLSLSGVGKVVELETGGHIAATGEFIYIQLKKGEQAFPRSRFHILEQVREISHPRRFFSTGKVICVQGEVEVVSLVNPSNNVYRARVIHSLFPISKGGIVRKGSPSEYTTTTPPDMQYLEMGRVRIIDGNLSNATPSSNFYALYSIVFLDAGSSQGLREGQVLNVFANQTRRLKKAKAKYSYPHIGHLKILRVEPHLATAVILYASEPILKWDLVGSDRVVPVQSPGENIQDTPLLPPSTDPQTDSQGEGGMGFPQDPSLQNQALPPFPQPGNTEQLEELEEPLSPAVDTTPGEEEELQQDTEELPAPPIESPLMKNPPESGPPSGPTTKPSSAR